MPETLAMKDTPDTTTQTTIQVDADDDDENDDDDALMMMDFPIADSTTTPIEAKPLKPALDTIWNDNALVQCLELSIIAFCNEDENIKEWKAPTLNDATWMPAKMQIPTWLKNTDPK